MHKLTTLLNRLDEGLCSAEQFPQAGFVTERVFADLLLQFGAGADHVHHLVRRFTECVEQEQGVNHRAAMRWLRALAHPDPAEAEQCDTGTPTSECGRHARELSGHADEQDDNERFTPVAPPSFDAAVEGFRSAPAAGLVVGQPSWVEAAVRRARSSCRLSRSTSRASGSHSNSRSQGVSPSPSVVGEGDGAHDREAEDHLEGIPLSAADSFHSDGVDVPSVCSGVPPSSTSLRTLFTRLDVATQGALSIAHLCHSLRRSGAVLTFHDLLHAAKAAGLCGNGEAPTAHTLVSAVDFTLLCAHLPREVLASLPCVASPCTERRRAPSLVQTTARCKHPDARVESSPHSPAEREAAPSLSSAASTPTCLQTWADVSVSPNTPTPRYGTTTPSVVAAATVSAADSAVRALHPLLSSPHSTREVTIPKHALRDATRAADGIGYPCNAHSVTSARELPESLGARSSCSSAQSSRTTMRRSTTRTPSELAVPPVPSPWWEWHAKGSSVPFYGRSTSRVSEGADSRGGLSRSLSRSWSRPLAANKAALSPEPATPPARAVPTRTSLPGRLHGASPPVFHITLLNCDDDGDGTLRSPHHVNEEVVGQCAGRAAYHTTSSPRQLSAAPAQRAHEHSGLGVWYRQRTQLPAQLGVAK